MQLFNRQNLINNEERAKCFVSFLDLLKVKHTEEFSNRYFNEHPHKNNLFGISKMLSDYGIENAGTRIVDKEKDLVSIELPFIAHIGGFVVVYNPFCVPSPFIFINKVKYRVILC